jgi:signal transduction histidine kinase
MRVPSPRKGNKPIHSPQESPTELSRHLLQAQEDERKRISRELHDGTGQGLMVLRLYLAMLASENLDSEGRLKAQEALRLLDHTIEDLRRIIGRLSPRVLEELGLLAAIRKEVRDLCRNTGLLASLDLPRELHGLGHEAEIALYRSLQESLHNIAKHSRARNFTVRLEAADGTIGLLVEDDGVGFSAKPSSRGGAYGLLGMRERIAAIGGKVRIRSRKEGGVSIRVVLPAPRVTLRGEEPEMPHALTVGAGASKMVHDPDSPGPHAFRYATEPEH